MSQETPPIPAPGTLLDGKYELKSCLGRGGAGSVYLARHLYMDREVAVKLLHPSLASNEKLRARFLREARLTSRLRHPNVITAHEFGMSGDMPYLVMEYVRGETLRSLMKKSGSVPASVLTTIGLQVSSALAAAHRLGIVHRDMKPDNVILKGEGRELEAKVLDFGVAKLFVQDDPSEATEPALTKPGAVQGTPKYAPPEQLRGEGVDSSADVYSFGVMLYEALVGEAPYEASSLIEYAAKHVTGTIEPPRVRNPRVQCSDELEALIMKCLSKQPRDRYHNGSELFIALSAQRDAELRFGKLPRGWVRGAAAVAVAAAVLIVVSVLVPGNGPTRPLSATAVPAPKAALQTPPAVEVIDEIEPRVESVESIAAEAPVPAPSAEEQLDRLSEEAQRAYDEGRASDAASLFRHVLVMRPDDARSKIYLGLTYRKLGRIEDAVTVFESLEPELLDDHDVAYELALLNAKIGRHETALKHLGVAAKGNEEYCEMARNEPAFEPLASTGEYKKITAPKQAPVRPARPATVAKAKEEPVPATPPVTVVERGFGRVLETLNHGIRSVF